MALHRRTGFWSFVLAAGLTVGMLGWQGIHLYDSYQAVAHRGSGNCPTHAISAISADSGRYQAMLDELDRRVMFTTDLAPEAWLADWTLRYGDAHSDLATSLDDGSTVGKEPVRLAIAAVGDAVDKVDSGTGDVVDSLRGGDVDAAGLLITRSGFRADRTELSGATAELEVRGREHLESQLDSERRQEMLSVGLSLGLFAMVAGSWVLYGRRLRVGRARLAAEEEQRRAVEIELQQAQKMDAVGLMAGGLAHNFNNLMMAIGGSASVAESHLETDHAAVPAIHRIREAAEQGNSLIDGLLTFSRKAPRSRDLVNVCELTHQTAAMLEEMLPGPIEFESTCPDDGACWVAGDRTQLQQALVNLALNACQAMPDGGQLALRVARSISDDHETVVMTVSDTGTGMLADVSDHMFEPFFTTRPRGEGTGLGLSIVHGIVTDHGGSVHVESVRGVGTDVRITLPLAPAPTEPPATLQVARTGTVVIAGNHRHTRDLVSGAVSSLGLDTAHVDGCEGLTDAVAGAGADLVMVISDDTDPAIDLVDCLEVLRDQPRDVPVVAITDLEPDAEWAANGATPLCKPFSLAQLRALVVRLTRESVTTP
ncbi:MAG: hypothetical protein KJP22_02240 [Acidimicrobiia bacterium]|nr:hypothetical protein [Acidimicrobiia bacterium]